MPTLILLSVLTCSTVDNRLPDLACAVDEVVAAEQMPLYTIPHAPRLRRQPVPKYGAAASTAKGTLRPNIDDREPAGAGPRLKEIPAAALGLLRKFVAGHRALRSIVHPCGVSPR